MRARLLVAVVLAGDTQVALAVELPLGWCLVVGVVCFHTGLDDGDRVVDPPLGERWNRGQAVFCQVVLNHGHGGRGTPTGAPLGEQFPEDRRFNPRSLNPYVLYKALPQVKRYSQEELVGAMDLLLRCNQRLVSSGLDEALVLQQTLVQIVGNKKVT